MTVNHSWNRLTNEPVSGLKCAAGFYSIWDDRNTLSYVGLGLCIIYFFIDLWSMLRFVSNSMFPINHTWCAFHNNLLRAAEFFCAQKEHMDTSQLSGKIRKKQIETVDHLHNFHHVSRGNIQFYQTHRNKDIASSQHTSFAAASTGSSLRFWGCGEFIIKSPWVDGWVVNHSHPRLW